MPIQFVNSFNNGINTTSTRNLSINFKSCSPIELPETDEKLPTKTKVGVFLSTLAGVGVAMAVTLKGKGYSINPKRIIKTPINKWGLFNAKYIDKEHHEVEKLVGRLAIGSVGGGLLGGAIFDKKDNLNAKFRESIIQLIGNISTPLAFVSLGTRAYEKYCAEKLNKHLPLLQETCKHNVKINRLIKGSPEVVVTIASLIAGIVTGNKVGNLINNHVFGIHDNRKIKAADMSPHLDDMCLGLSLVAPDSQIGAVVTRIIPAALMIAGVSTGLSQEKPAILEQKRVKNSCKNTNKTN